MFTLNKLLDYNKYFYINVHINNMQIVYKYIILYTHYA